MIDESWRVGAGSTRLPGVAHDIDGAFLDLPLAALADAALSRAAELGAEHADIRVERLASARLTMRDAAVESSERTDHSGFGVRVIVDGAWGFAAATELMPDAVAAAAARAVDVARVTARACTERIELAPEPAYGEVRWVSAYDVDPLDVPEAEQVELLGGWSRRLLSADEVAHVDVELSAVRENKFYADLAGTSAIQQRVRVHPSVTAVWVDDSGGFESMATLAPPAGRGFEYLTGTGWDWDGELAELPSHLGEKAAAPTVEAGSYDLVIDPTNLWLTIHESVAHATELDRALGYEANYAGTSWATFDGLGTTRFGSPAMNVTGDRVTPHGLSTVGYDDEGVAAQQWDVVRDGILVGYQLDRRTAALKGFDRSNGCAFADGPGRMPIQRMPNVSLQPDLSGPDTAGLIAGVERGIYAVGDKSWSIDMQRFNFQFTAQRFYLIRGGQLAGQLRDVAYQGSGPTFWGSLEAVGGPSTYLLAGAFNCGKGQPSQVAPVSHGCPSALFRGVRILNTRQESGR